MGLFGTKKEDIPAIEPPPGFPEIEGAPSPSSQMRAPVAPQAVPARFGIDHAIGLIRSLPTDENLELVVKVLKTTLESLGIRITDIVNDAAQRQRDLENRTSQLRSEIEHLEKEIDQRAKQIEQLDAAHAEATKVRNYLEGQLHLGHDDGVGRLPRIS